MSAASVIRGGVGNETIIGPGPVYWIFFFNGINCFIDRFRTGYRVQSRINIMCTYIFLIPQTSSRGVGDNDVLSLVPFFFFFCFTKLKKPIRRKYRYLPCPKHDEAIYLHLKRNRTRFFARVPSQTRRVWTRVFNDTGTRVIVDIYVGCGDGVRVLNTTHG